MSDTHGHSAAILAAAIIQKSDFSPKADIHMEAMNLYQQIRASMQQTADAAAKRPTAAEQSPGGGRPIDRR